MATPSALERALLLASFASAVGFGMLLPLLPLYLSATGSNEAVHSAVLPIVFLAGAALTAPVWGAVSDRLRRDRVLMVGLALTAVAVVPFLAVHSLPMLYVYQVLGGIAFGAVAPVALAMLYEAAASGGRGIAWFGGATLAGYVAAPAAAGWIGVLAVGGPPHAPVVLALVLQAALAVAALSLLIARRCVDQRRPIPEAAGERRAWNSVGAGLLIAFLIGGFEITVALYVRSPLHFQAHEVATIFTLCSASMIASQLLLLPRLRSNWSRPRLTSGCIALSALLMATLGFSDRHAVILAVTALQGASLGLAIGLVSFEAAAISGGMRGSVLGYQSAAINTGQALGSALGAAAFAMFGTAAFPALGVAALAASALLLPRVAVP